MRSPKSVLVYDISNILFRVAAVQKHQQPKGKNPFSSPRDLVGLCMHISLQSIYKWYRKYRPEFVIFAFEGGNNWRKAYTAKENVRRLYKGNRVRDPEMDHFYELINAFEEVIKHHTSICCLTVKTTEADDVIGVYARIRDPETKVYIVSGDRDFIQLLKYPNTYLVNVDDGKLRNQLGDKEYQEDLDFWLFLKCIRGDTGDNVLSAYPRVYETKVRKAFDDEFARVNFMNTTWKDEHDVEHRVGDLYEQNRVLLGLDDQPAEIKALLEAEIPKQLTELSKYSHFHFLKFLGEYKLQRVGEEASKFIELFTSNQRWLQGEKLFEASNSQTVGGIVMPAKKEDDPKPQSKTDMLDF